MIIRRGRRLAAGVAAVVAATVCASAPAGALAAEAPGAGAAAPGTEAGPSEARISGWTLPSRTHTRKDGVVIREAEPAAVQALVVAAAANPGCGYACEGEDPASYLITPPGGPSYWYRCGDDAVTVREAYLPGGSSTKVELRYSPRCRTAWARGTTPFFLYTYSYWSRTSHDDNYRTHTFAGRNLHVPSYTVHWTAMVNDAGLYARACMWTEGTGLDCTSRY
jgi:hypothetical protein